MNLKDQDLSLFDETLSDQAYLTDTQIGDIRLKVESAGNTFPNESDTIKTLDDFVRGNGRADERYLRLKELADKAMALFSSDLDYSEQVKMGLLPISIMAYFDLLLLVGVYKEDELSMSVHTNEAPNGSHSNEA